jgi:hypothetical protein
MRKSRLEHYRRQHPFSCSFAINWNHFYSSKSSIGKKAGETSGLHGREHVVTVPKKMGAGIFVMKS